MPFIDPDPGAPPDVPWWSRPADAVLADLKSRPDGLGRAEAQRRLVTVGANSIKPAAGIAPLALLARQFASPLVIILVVAAAISSGVGEHQEAIIIALIISASCGLGFTQEYSASRAMQSLQRRLSHKVTVRRDGQDVMVAADNVVPGDIVRLSAGALVPADGLLLDTDAFNVSEAALTGETFPVVKMPGISPGDATLAQRSNCVFAGTSVRSGTATAVVVATGRKTQFARIAEAIERQAPETEFARGIRNFGVLMMQIMLVMVLVVLAANLFLHRPVIDSLLFSLALAVGITPELLPAIISVTLATGARRMAADGVIVRRLDAIENLGSMTVLCSDKTGTLTRGVVILNGAVDITGQASASVLDMARLNAGLQTGMRNALDDAILADGAMPAGARLGEIPYDFVRQRLSVSVRLTAGDVLICKGAVRSVLDICTSLQGPDGALPMDDQHRAALDDRFQQWSDQGFRVLALASRSMPRDAPHGVAGERDMTLNGFLLFFDPAREGVQKILASLASAGIQVKMITGDNRYMARHIAEAVGIDTPAILTGEDLRRMNADALFARAPATDVFAEIDPNQKERIVAALRRAGHVVGYLGDGINDAPALHEADIGISVDSAVDVAREAADIILLKQDLGVLLTGIRNGRTTFVNTLKYISITTSANFGNMVSMALASLFLPFLPLLPKQILLNNFLSDVPSMAIATDSVEGGVTRTPKRWDIGYVRRFMICFGLISSLFDVVTFVYLLWAAGASQGVFQTAWFVESLVTELAIVFVVRTRQPIWKSHPGAWLTWLTLFVAALAVALPYLPFASLLGLEPLPLSLMAGLATITLAYLATSEAAKHWFFHNERHARRRGPRHPAAVLAYLPWSRI